MEGMTTPALFWFRQDPRLADSRGLALLAGRRRPPVLPVRLASAAVAGALA